MEKSIRKIIKWTLEYLHMDSEDARDLIYKTGMAESGYRALEGYGKNPAIGFWQVEPFTMFDTIDNYINYRPELKTKIYGLGYDEKDAEMRLMSNMSLQVAFCRLKYRRDKYALPGMDDIEAQAKYWKRVYNSEKGRGTVEHFIKANK
jgi:hypothetical protein